MHVITYMKLFSQSSSKGKLRLALRGTTTAVTTAGDISGGTGSRAWWWENGETLINCLAYIDLNPVRAGLVKRPEDYRRRSIGYHIQSGNKGNLLSLDFGLKEFGVLSAKKRRGSDFSLPADVSS